MKGRGISCGRGLRNATRAALREEGGSSSSSSDARLVLVTSPSMRSGLSKVTLQKLLPTRGRPRTSRHLNTSKWLCFDADEGQESAAQAARPAPHNADTRNLHSQARPAVYVACKRCVKGTTGHGTNRVTPQLRNCREADPFSQPIVSLARRPGLRTQRAAALTTKVLTQLHALRVTLRGVQTAASKYALPLLSLTSISTRPRDSLKMPLCR